MQSDQSKVVSQVSGSDSGEFEIHDGSRNNSEMVSKFDRDDSEDEEKEEIVSFRNLTSRHYLLHKVSDTKQQSLLSCV